MSKPHYINGLHELWVRTADALGKEFERNKKLVAELEAKQAEYDKMLNDLLDDSGMDLSPCRTCGETVICIPDGLALCKACAEKAGGA